MIRLVAATLVLSCTTLPAAADPPARTWKGVHWSQVTPQARDRAPDRSRAASLVTNERLGPGGDVTGDGRADLVVRDPGPDAGSLRLFVHDGSPAGNPWATQLGLGGSWDFADILLLGDVTGDGRPDVVARDPAAGNGTLWVYPHNGATSGNPWTTRIQAGTDWNRYNTILLGDVTGDGRPELLGRDPAVASGTLWIHPHGAGTNPWSAPRVWAGTGWNLANAMLLADANGDDHLDILARDGAGALWVYPHNRVTSGNPYTSRYGAGTGWGFATVLLAADATGDGRPDALAVGPDGTLWVYPHNGSVTANPYTVSRYAAGTGWGFANALIAGDASGDGRPDLLGRVHAGDLWVYPHSGAAQPWQSRFSAGTRWGFENQLLLGDVTGDGRPDLVARDPLAANGDLWIYPHTGATDSDPWTGGRAWGGSGWNTVTAMLLGDLTGDGRPDLVARDRAGDLWIYPHNRSSTGNPWTVPRTWAGTGWNTARILALADATGDGRPDLVDLEQDGSLWIYPTGGAAPIRVGGDWSGVTALTTGDATGDGRPDLVTRDSGGELRIHPHDGATGNPWPSSFPAGTGWSFASALLL